MKLALRTAIEREPAKLKSRLSEIIVLSNGEREALGFLPNAAYGDAIAQKRLFAILADNEDGESAVVGYILYGGVFPHARVQQVCTKPDWRRHKVASALIDALVCDLERAGFLTVKAKVASDLAHAQAFYEKHGFETVTSKAGGNTRARTIVVRVRNLATPHLFSADPSTIDLGFPKRFGTEASSFYTFDLNVFFDLVKNRQRHNSACALFGAALDHRIRLGIASEFVSELTRTSADQKNDPVLQMALQLPRLPPPVNAQDLERLASQIHAIVFTSRNSATANSTQAWSDARHLAHSALSRVSGFITSDSALLEARDELLARVGIDVAGLDELLTLLPDAVDQQSPTQRRGEGFECRTPSADEAVAYLKGRNVPASVIEGAFGTATRCAVWRSAIWQQSKIVAVACLASPVSTAGEDRLLINVDPGHLDRELYAEYLLDAAIKQACLNNPAAIRLLNVPGQPTVSALATARGFISTGTGHDLVKIAIGQPVTQESWEATRQSTRRKTGLTLPAQWPDFRDGSRGIAVTSSAGQSLNLTPERFEDMFGPTLYLWPGREAVIVPIQRAYADELLGTNTQTRLSFIADRDASFLSRRAYVNTPRARNAMRPGLPILFYESGKNGGRSAVVAAGRIVDSVLVPKEAASGDAARRVVVDDLSGFSAMDEVLMTTFDNLLVFHAPVRFATLKELGAVGSSNLISATPLSHENLALIVGAAWSK